MAFSGSTFSRVSGANSDSGTMWFYKTGDLIATAVGANYFNGAYDSYGLSSGDIIFISAVDAFRIVDVVESSGNITINTAVTPA